MEVSNLDFFGYNEDQRRLLHLLALAGTEAKKHKLLLMAAPSFVVDFNPHAFVSLMKGLGFDKVTELTFGAKIVNEHYHKFIGEHFSAYQKAGKKRGKKFQKVFISSVCPASVELVRHAHPKLKKYLMPFVSPMAAMAKIVRKNFPNHIVVFLAPCSAKKFEAAHYFEGKGKKRKRLIDAVVTFAEMRQIVAKEKPAELKGKHDFDSFYNDYTKVYPLSGGLSSTLHFKGILHKSDMAAADGCDDLTAIFDSHPDKVFYDILFCKGGCIGGPGVASHAPLRLRRQRVIRYRRLANRRKSGGKVGLEKYTKGIDFSRKFF